MLPLVVGSIPFLVCAVAPGLCLRGRTGEGVLLHYFLSILDVDVAGAEGLYAAALEVVDWMEGVGGVDVGDAGLLAEWTVVVYYVVCEVAVAEDLHAEHLLA